MIPRSKVLLGSEFSRSDPTQAQLLRCVMRVLEFCVPPCRMIINDRAAPYGMTEPSGLIVGRFSLQAGPGESRLATRKPPDSYSLRSHHESVLS